MNVVRWFSPPENLKERFLYLYGDFPYSAWLDSNGNTQDTYGKYEFIAGCADHLAFTKKNDKEFLSYYPGLLFGGLSYPALQQTEPIQEALKPDRISFPPFFFFAPQFILRKSYGESFVIVEAEEPEAWIQKLESLHIPEDVFLPFPCSEKPESGISVQAYKDKVLQIQSYITEGLVYEANLSRNLYVSAELKNPHCIFPLWVKNSPSPFSAYFKWEHLYVYSSSPERFMANRSGKLISQPIKGTARRMDDLVTDLKVQASLQASQKDRAENLMIVDLVRNDLNKSCIPGTVEVPELCGLHSFPWVHHLISTITGTLRNDLSPEEALLYAFPPGSMTGAPKVSAMKIINNLEPEGRGLFAGCIGYKEAKDSFDFNVIIRTLIYDAKQHLLAYHAGGAVTIDSDPAEEYDETVAKAAGLKRWLRSYEL